MLKNQTVNHVSEHLSAICPVYTQLGEGLRTDVAEGDKYCSHCSLQHGLLLTGKKNPSIS